MGCDQVREMLSAQLDGEDLPGERAVTEAHLAGCAGCRRWLDSAAAVTRVLSTRPADAGPAFDVVATVLPAAPRRRDHTRLANALRLLLGLLGGVQMMLGVAQIAGAASVQHAHGTANHVWHESAAWNVAVGAGFLWIAVRRGRAAGMVPTLTAFIGVLTVLIVNDLILSTVDLGRVLGHGFMVSGYVVVLLMSRLSRRTGVPPSGMRAPVADTTVGTTPDAPIGRPQLRLIRGIPAPGTPQNRRRDAA